MKATQTTVESLLLSHYYYWTIQLQLFCFFLNSILSCFKLTRKLDRCSPPSNSVKWTEIDWLKKNKIFNFSNRDKIGQITKKADIALDSPSLALSDPSTKKLNEIMQNQNKQKTYRNISNVQLPVIHGKIFKQQKFIGYSKWYCLFYCAAGL